MLKKFIVFSILFFRFFTSVPQVHPDNNFIDPLKPPFSFSGSFGELRKNHLHTGLDFRTNGRIGLPVYAVKDGFVSRINISASGYGHALYLQHNDGHTSVYGHLSGFDKKIEKFIKDEQYKRQSFSLDLSLPNNLFIFKKGNIVAYSGNTGSSGGPHLHYEIRDTKTENPQNPLFYLPEIVDKSSPRISSVYLYALNSKSYVTKNARKKRIDLVGNGKSYKFKLEQPVEVFGEIGIGIEADDDFNGSGFKCGLYSAKMLIDNKTRFSFQMNQLSFALGRSVNSHIDYEESILSKKWIHRLFLQPGNKLNIYLTDSNKGRVVLNDGKIHSFEIIVADAFGNESHLFFKLKSKIPSVFEKSPQVANLFKYDQPNIFENKEIKINLPANTLFEDLDFHYQYKESTRSFLSAIHQIHNRLVPVDKPYSISLKAKSIPLNKRNKALIVQIGSDGQLSSIGGKYSDSWVTSKARTFGDFAVALDTIPPVIRPLTLKNNKTLTDKSTLKFHISDNLSGIEKYSGEIDGKWVLFEFDAKTGTLYFTFDKEKIDFGKLHSLKLNVEDERGNSSKYAANFYL